MFEQKLVLETSELAEISSIIIIASLNDFDWWLSKSMIGTSQVVVYVML